MKAKLLATLGALCFFAGISLPALTAEPPKDKLDLTQRYFMLETNQRSTLEKELKQAAAAGFRIVAGSRATQSYIMEKVAEPTNAYEYVLLVLVSVQLNAETMQKRLNEAAANGFRLMPRKMDQWGDELLGMMEKEPGGQERYQYLVLDTMRNSTLQKEMAQAVREGYSIVALLSTVRHVAILEKRASSPSGPPAAPADLLEVASGQRYLWLATNSTAWLVSNATGALKKELKEAAASGYQNVVGALGSRMPTVLVLERVAEPGPDHEYLLLDVQKASTLQKEMNQAGAKGFRLLPGTMTQLGYEMVAVMEKAPGSEQHYEYAVLLAFDKTAQQDLVRLVEEGYRLLGMSEGGSEVMLERAIAK